MSSAFISYLSLDKLQCTLVLIPEPVVKRSYRSVIGMPFSGFPLSTSMARTEYSKYDIHSVADLPNSIESQVSI